jgi:hypothetical protein
MTRDDIIRMARLSVIDLYGPMPDEKMYDVFIERCAKFAHLVAAAEREAIADEWWSCWQADMEHGVKCLNENAVEKFQKQYRNISEFCDWLNSREDE